MALRWSKVSPQLALTPAVAVTLVAFIGAIGWTIYISFTRSRRFPDYTINPEEWGRQYARLFNDNVWWTALSNLLVLGIGSALAIVFGFVLAAMVEREKRGEGFFRTVFLYPLASRSSSRALSGGGCSIRRSASKTSCTARLGKRQLQLARAAAHRHVRHHPRLDLARSRLLHGPDAGGLKSINTEI